MDKASISRQLRRAEWFDYICRRFDLVSFRDLADWIATEQGSVRRNEADREQALVDLEDSVKRGEFGPAHEKRCIPWLQKPPRSDMQGKLCLRLNYGQIVGTRATADLYASRALCLKWLEARQIPLPPWLKHPETPAREPVAAYASGAPGRPSSMHLVEQEMKRRKDAGEMIKVSLAKEAAYLVQWLKTEHPDAPPLTEKTIQNQLGASWRALGGAQFPEKK